MPFAVDQPIAYLCHTCVKENTLTDDILNPHSALISAVIERGIRARYTNL
jgi:hypothetical protein